MSLYSFIRLKLKRLPCFLIYFFCNGFTENKKTRSAVTKRVFDIYCVSVYFSPRFFKSGSSEGSCPRKLR